MKPRRCKYHVPCRWTSKMQMQNVDASFIPTIAAWWPRGGRRIFLEPWFTCHMLMQRNTIPSNITRSLYCGNGPDCREVATWCGWLDSAVHLCSECGLSTSENHFGIPGTTLRLENQDCWVTASTHSDMSELAWASPSLEIAVFRCSVLDSFEAPWEYSVIDL